MMRKFKFVIYCLTADLTEIEIMLPLAISNRKSKNISNLLCGLRKSLLEEQKSAISKKEYIFYKVYKIY